MVAIKFFTRFAFGDVVDFDSSIYGKGQGCVDSIMLHPDGSVSYVLDVHPGNIFGGPSPNLFGGFTSREMELTAEQDYTTNQDRKKSEHFFSRL